MNEKTNTKKSEWTNTKNIPNMKGDKPKQYFQPCTYLSNFSRCTDLKGKAAAIGKVIIAI